MRDAICGIVGEVACNLIRAVIEAAAQCAAPVATGTLLYLLLQKQQQKSSQPRRPLPVIGFIRARWAQVTGRVPSWTGYYEQEP